jgi:hypothetical protein
LSKKNGGYFFNSAEVETLIAHYQRTECHQTLGQIIERCRPIALSLIRDKATMRHVEVDELMSAVNNKLLRSLPSYDPARGTAFAFVSRLTCNMLCTQVTHRKKLAARYPALERTFELSIVDHDQDFDSTVALDDLVHRIKTVRSAAIDQAERDAQKWYVDSFIDAGFEMRRHEVSDAAMRVYGLSHRRSRDLYDLTLLEIRRVLWTETKHAPVDANVLRGTKGLPLLRYTRFLTEEEFAKFAALMRGLAPILVVLVKPENAIRIKGQDWNATRENLLLILNGNPLATPLFESE